MKCTSGNSCRIRLNLLHRWPCWQHLNRPKLIFLSTFVFYWRSWIENCRLSSVCICFDADVIYYDIIIYYYYIIYNIVFIIFWQTPVKIAYNGRCVYSCCKRRFFFQLLDWSREIYMCGLLNPGVSTLLSLVCQKCLQEIESVRYIKQNVYIASSITKRDNKPPMGHSNFNNNPPTMVSATAIIISPGLVTVH